MDKLNRLSRLREDLGQSLVEIALFLPLFVVIIAGIVEVSNLLITQNRVTTASRISAGFGASNFDSNDWAIIVDGECSEGTACSMGTVAINTVTETLDLSPDLWDVWSINARFNSDGTAFEVFTHTHSYGNSQVIPPAEWAQLVSEVQAEMLADFQEGETEDLAVVATVAYHDINTILGLPIWQWTGLQTIRGLTVMRVDEHLAFGGCPILPIAIRLQQWSLYPTNWDELGGPNLSGYSDEQVPKQLFPEPGDWQYPVPAPVYTQTSPVFTETTHVTAMGFSRNVPGVRLTEAKPGHLYWARDLNAFPGGNFGWLSWHDVSDAPTLGTSLTWPGNFVDPDPTDDNHVGYKGSTMDLGTSSNCPGPLTGNGDGHLAIGEWVANATGEINSSTIVDAMQFYVDTGVPIYLIVFEFTNGEPHPPEWTCSDNSGNNVHFRVHDFAKVRLIGYDGTGNDKFVVFEFLGWGLECNKPQDQ
jgi:hypothetical protein